MTTRSSRRAPAGLDLTERLEESLVLALFDLANHLQRRGEKLAGLAGLTTQQWLVLLQIAGDRNFPYSERDASKPLLASDIARMRGVSRATISTIITALKDRGFVSETEDPEDRRRRFLEITPAGVAALRLVEPQRRAANERLLGELDHAERKRLLSYLQGCLAVLWDLLEDEQVDRRRKGIRKRDD